MWYNFWKILIYNYYTCTVLYFNFNYAIGVFTQIRHCLAQGHAVIQVFCPQYSAEKQTPSFDTMVLRPSTNPGWNIPLNNDKLPVILNYNNENKLNTGTYIIMSFHCMHSRFKGLRQCPCYEDFIGVQSHVQSDALLNINLMVPEWAELRDFQPGRLMHNCTLSNKPYYINKSPKASALFTEDVG